MFKFYLYKIGQFLVSKLSLQNAYRLGIFMSMLQYWFSPRDRRAVKNNLRVITGSDEGLDEKAREVFRNFGKYLVEFFRMANEIDLKFVQQKVRVIHPEFLQEAIDQKKGVIFMTAHIGSWELGGLCLGVMGYPTLAIALPHKERPVNELFNQQRERRGVTVVPVHQAVHRCLSALKSNKFIGVLSDRDFTNNGEVLPFLGKDVLIPKGAALFAYKTGATILPTFFLRNPDDTFSLHFEKPIYPAQLISGQVERDQLVALMTQYKTLIEDKIRQYPTQWLMFREFWDPKSNIVGYNFNENS